MAVAVAVVGMVVKFVFSSQSLSGEMWARGNVGAGLLSTKRTTEGKSVTSYVAK